MISILFTFSPDSFISSQLLFVFFQIIHDAQLSDINIATLYDDDFEGNDEKKFMPLEFVELDSSWMYKACTMKGTLLFTNLIFLLFM